MDAPFLHHNRFALHLQERQGYDAPILIKEPATERPDPATIAELHNEYAIATQLADVRGVRRVYGKEGSESHPLLLLEHIQGQTLGNLARSGSLPLMEKLQLASAIVGILAQMHEHHLVHRDVSADNILVAEDGTCGVPGGPFLIDFGIATTIRQESQPRLKVADVLPSTLAYISPEQTGRINRLVDHRTDLYSLGVVLYELITGELPFQTDDLLEMIHCHLARQPKPPHEVNAGIPMILSRIVLKLLSKNSEDRYQTAHGLQTDLHHCLDQMQTAGRIEPFDLGRNDFSDRLQIPQKLYGREQEINQVQGAYTRVTEGKSELLLVGGLAGVGKTALVHEIRTPVSIFGGAFVEGKFDQYQRDVPFAAWVQAFSALINEWMTESDTQLIQRRDTIQAAVGDNGQVLIDLIPALEFVIGPQPSTANLGGREAENRLVYLFLRLVSAIATPAHPLVIFLDDVQWIDLASLSLLKSLLADQHLKHVLIIGAFRDNEVSSIHPLMLGIDDLKESGTIVSQITLGDLTTEDLAQLLSEGLHTPHNRCLPLAELLQRKTGGNAFFTRHLLFALENQGLLSFDDRAACWHWEMEKISKLAVSESVVDLLTDRQRRLPVATQAAMQVAACIGNRFDVKLLGLASDTSYPSTQKALEPAYQEGLLIASDGVTLFAHDRIQQAAYFTLPELERVSTHWRIGRALLSEIKLDGTEEARDREHLFDIVRHLNIGSSLIEAKADRIELAELNLKAAQDALRATAFASALAYARSGIDLLADEGWQNHYRLTLDLHQAAADAAYLHMDLEESEKTVAAILAEVRPLLDRVPALITQIRVHNARNEMDTVMEIGMALLEELGFPLAQAAPPEMSVQTVSNLQPMTDPRALAATNLLNNLMVTAYVAKPELFPGIVFTSMRISLEHGLHPTSPLSVSTVGVLTWDQDIAVAYEWGKLALQLVDRLDTGEYLAQVKIVFDGFILPWKKPYRHAEREAISDIQLGLESGAKVWVASAVTSATYLSVIGGHPLDYAQEQIEQYMQVLQDIGERYALYNVAVWRQFIANMRGMSADPVRLEGEFYSEARDLPLAHAANMHVPVFFTHLLKLVLEYHLGDYPSAFSASIEAEESVGFLRSHVSVPWLPFYQSLTILQLRAVQDDQSGLSEKLRRNIRSLQRWAKHARMNLQHKVDLVLAEQARVEGDAAALDFYEAAMAGARENGILHEEALANELFGRFWIQRGNEAFAEHSICRAHALYVRWGATAVLEYLESRYPSWLTVEPSDADRRQWSGDRQEPPVNLDLQSILRASQAVTVEIDLERLLGRLINIAMENAGAQRGFLISEQDGEWMIEAANETDEGQLSLIQRISVTETGLLSAGVVHYVARMQQTVVLDDAAKTSEFMHDPYIQQNQVQSLLCLPLVNQGKTSAILYLENNLAANVFTSERVALLEMLASQMAISLDNARLVEQLGTLLALRTTALKSAETQIRTLFESAPLGISLSSREGRLLAVNPAMLQMTGYSEAEILELNAIDLYYEPEQRAEFLQRLEAADRVRDFGLRVVRKDGTPFYASLNANKLDSATDLDSFLVVVENVTAKVLTEQALQESNRNLVNLLESAKTMTSALELDDLLRVIFEQLGRVAAYSGAVIWLREGDELVAQASWPAEALETLPQARLPRGLLPSTASLLSIRRPITDDDAPSIRRLFPANDAATEAFGPESIHSTSKLLAIPLIAKDLLIGVIGLVYDKVGYFTPEMTDLVQAFANQAAIAIDNAHLHQQVQKVAVLEERDRLARELHDAVTQTLFSASVIAETAPLVWKQDSQTALQYLEPLPVMLRGALAEMRTLLLELRPDTLRDQSLGQLLNLLADSVRVRTRATVNIIVEGERSLSEEVTMTFYRIVQESLNNVVKHAEASQINIWLIGSPDGIELHISDDGRGFDPASVPPGHLGLGIMADRARQIGATFEIDSEAGNGTLILVSWMDPAPSPV